MKKSQQGIALIWIIIAGALLVIGVGVVSSGKQSQKVKELPEVSPIPASLPTLQSPPLPPQEDISQQDPLLKILPPKERAELENAIREAQQVLQNVEVFDYTPPSIDDITKGLDQINKQTQEQIQKNIQKQQQEEYFNQNPPAVPHEGEQVPPEAQEYYYRKHILKDPAFQY